MARTYRKPTFSTPIEVWKLQPDLTSWLRLPDDLIGQVYTQKRTPDNAGEAGTYFVYPKEDDVLRDVFDYGGGVNSDVVVISFPTGAPRRVAYRVTCVEPRWLKFGNEHLMASLAKMTPAELATVETGGPPPPPPPPTPPATIDLGFGLFTDAECNDCEVLQGPYVLNLTTDTPDNKIWSGNFVWSCTSPEDVTVTVNYVPSLSILNIVFTTPDLGSFVQWLTTVSNWDYLSTVVAPLEGATSTLCDWSANATVNPPT